MTGSTDADGRTSHRVLIAEDEAPGLGGAVEAALVKPPVPIGVLRKLLKDVEASARDQKPLAIGGSLGRKEATGRGVAFLVDRALEQLKMPDHSRIIVQGFGNVGSYAAYGLAKYGARIVGVGDQTGAVYDPKGIEVEKLFSHFQTHRSLVGFSEGHRLTNDELLVQPCEVLIPAATERAITADTALRLSRYFGTRPGWWLDLQSFYDLEAAGDELEARIARTVKPCSLLPVAA